MELMNQRILSFVCLSALVVVYLSDLCQSTLVIKPNNSAVVRGTNVTLHCSTSESGSVRWLRILSKHKEPLVIYRSFEVHGDKSIYHVADSTDGQFNLVVNTRSPKSHGLFVCEDGTGEVDPVKVERAGAEVIVIDSLPVCNSSLKELDQTENTKHECRKRWEELTATCSISYHGNWSPTMEWRKGRGSTIPEDFISQQPGSNTVRSTLVVNISESVEDIVCTTKFSSSIVLQQSHAKRGLPTSWNNTFLATNVPETTIQHRFNINRTEPLDSGDKFIIRNDEFPFPFNLWYILINIGTCLVLLAVVLGMAIYVVHLKRRLAFLIGMPESGYRILPVSPRISLVSQVTNVEQSDFDFDQMVHTGGSIAETGLTNDLNSSTIKSDTVNIISNIKLHP